MLRHLFHLLRLICAVGLLWWVAEKLHLEEMADFGWNSLNLGWLMLALCFGALSVLGWAGRWWWFLRVYDLRPRFAELLRLTFFADFFNLYFLGPLGADGVRLVGLSKHFPDKRGAIMGSLLLDHVGGLFGGVILYYVWGRDGVLPAAVVMAADRSLPALIIITVLGLGVIMEPPIQRLIAGIKGLRRISDIMSPVYAGTFRHPWLFPGFAVSLLSTACAYTAFWATGKAVGAELPLPHMLGLMPAVDFAASLPVSVSGLGVREGLLIEWLPIGSVQALALSLLGFAAIGLWGLIGGLWLLFDRRRNGAVTPP
jgi:uncharacterized membrane protein YbhN (UPF0104 family)